MDTTRIEELLTELETSDPARAPDVADELTAALANQLDGTGSTDSDSSEESASDTDGGSH
ncbi:MAG: hypothetical protein ACR2NL_09630 [Acidimicrobiia bacterium]